MDYGKKSLIIHKKHHGKLAVVSKVPLKTRNDLSVAYTPGVAEPCKEIAKDKTKVYNYTIKGNSVAIVTDGSRVLGLGNIGPEAALPVMEGKAILFKTFGNIDAFPICLATQDANEIIDTVKRLAPVFGGINLEDIEAPKCFEIEARLRQELDIPVLHDDQHGTAVVVLAALFNALRLVKKSLETTNIVVNGAGAAGIAIAKMLRTAGAKNVISCDTAGVIYAGRKAHMTQYKEEIATETTKRTLADAMDCADAFIGVSGPNTVTRDLISMMNKDAIVFALANPIPEIMPNEAKKGGACVVATGRSDFPNQINNVLAFPGIFRGLLDARVKQISYDMLLAAAYALAGIIRTPNDRSIIPSVLDKRVAKTVAKAVIKAAKNPKAYK